ncbi:DUF4136 domain-containing protein [Terrimonas sp.]|uniref:DUF4136 domain-containing protein n=1 Tax=Terrimonas sp. TaxID=1914338 RepID=UPI000D517B29|nr:DUF4136 domain-containing protein [Terrimonas sp.]PVD52243.1 DUF4136 domain-containing protein [Terrimonas sp.]
MKKLNRGYLSSLLLVFAAFASCKKLPPVDNLSSDFVVETKYDTSVHFTTFKTFAIRDTITVATENPKDSVWYDADAQTIINEVAKQMKAVGYTQVMPGDKGGADLGIQLIGIRNRTIFNVTPGYWWGFPGYGDPYYWGDFYGYPYWNSYWYSYSIKTGSLIVEMANLKDAVANQKLNIIWTGIGSGQIGNSKSFVLDQCIKTVDQAFLQSPYLHQSTQ